MGPWEHPKWCSATRSGIGAPKVPFSAKMTKMPWSTLGLTKGQTKSKLSQNNIFHSFTLNPSFSEIFNNFDQVWLEVDLGGPKNPNFDPSVKTSWNQCHCEDYQILIPTTVHGSKSELDRSRCHENGDNALINAPLTFKSHNFLSNRWIFKIHTFSKTGIQDPSKHVKINPIKGGLRLATLEGPPPQHLCRDYKKPQAPFRQRGITFFLSFALCLVFLHIFLSSKHQNTPKNTSKLLDSSLFTKNTRYCYYTQSSFPWFYTWDLGLKGVDEAF